MFYKVIKLSENFYNIKKFDKEFRLIEVLESKNSNNIIKKFKELKEPEHNVFWYNSNDKLQWEVI